MGKTELSKRGTDENKLSDRERRFVNEYVIDYDGKRAAIASGYSAPNVAAQRLLKRPTIMRAIGKREYITSEELQLSLGDVIEQLYYCVTRSAEDFCDEEGHLITDVHKLSKRARAAIDGIEQTVHLDNQGGQTIKTRLRLVPKAAAIDMAMKHKGAYAPVKVESEHTIKLDWSTIQGRDDKPDAIEQRLIAEGKGIED